MYQSDVVNISANNFSQSVFNLENGKHFPSRIFGSSQGPQFHLLLLLFIILILPVIFADWIVHPIHTKMWIYLIISDVNGNDVWCEGWERLTTKVEKMNDEFVEQPTSQQPLLVLGEDPGALSYHGISKQEWTWTLKDGSKHRDGCISLS